MMYVAMFGIITLLGLCILLYLSTAHSILKALAFACALLFGAVTTNHYLENLGAPIQGYPDGDFTYLHHVIDPDGSIKLWAVTGNKHRLYAFDYDRTNAERLEEAKTQTETGGRMVGHFEDGNVSHLTHREGSDMITNEVK